MADILLFYYFSSQNLNLPNRSNMGQALVLEISIIIHTVSFLHITVNIKQIIWIHCPIVSHSWLTIHVSITTFTGHLDWVPARMETISISHVRLTS